MKFALIANTSWGHYNSRSRLAATLRDHGHEVVFLSPLDEYSRRLVDEGFRWLNLPFLPRGRNILREGAAIVAVARLLKAETPDVVHNFTPKGVIYGSIAAKSAGLRQIANTITGLGRFFSTPSGGATRWIVTWLYRLALRNTKVIFQNPDDQAFFAQLHITSGMTTMLIPGSGVDDTRFLPQPEAAGTPVVVLPSRFVAEKGIRDFVEAARLLRSQRIAVRLVLVGRPEPDQPTAIPMDEITTWVAQGLVEWWGWHESMEKIYPLAHAVCLPTYYKEGIPKSLLEAAACGRPIVATDVAGCREIVQDGVNGLLVPPKSPSKLAEAIGALASDPALRKRMGASGREMVERTYSLDRIIPQYLKLYGLAA